MESYLSEQEQIESIKKFIKQYLPAALVGVLIAFAISFGWKYWQNYKTDRIEMASKAYQHMLDQMGLDGAVSVPDLDGKANYILAHYPDTAYASLAALLAASVSAEKDEFDVALSKIQWVLDHSSQPPLKNLALVRKARVLLAQKKWQAALEIANSVESSAFSSLCADIRGDAYVGLEQILKAREEYRLALRRMPRGQHANMRALLKMKIAELGEL